VTTEPVRTWGSAEAAEVWRQGAARRMVALAIATERMFEAAGLAPGQRILDVAAGTGDQTILAAHCVGPTGCVLATDISASMLAVAAEAVREAGLHNVVTRVADASALEPADLTAAADTGKPIRAENDPNPEELFDAAICRFGLMFVPDLHQALVRVRRVLKPGGKFAALVWSSEDKNPYIGLQIGLVREMGRMPSPPPTLALTVSLSAPGKLERALVDAGFVESSINVASVPVPREFATLDEALGAMRSSSPAQGELARVMTEVEQAHYWAELRQRVQVYVQADGRCLMPGEALCAVGTK
jgi:SAM-dependent methyltransferase